MAIARLGASEHELHGRGRLRVAMDGIIGSDLLSTFFHLQMRQAGVEVLAHPAPGSCTGIALLVIGCLVLVALSVPKGFDACTVCFQRCDPHHVR